MRIAAVLVLATVLSACGGAGAGGAAPQTTPTTVAPKTTVPAVAGTEAPKDYSPGKTANPSASPDEYFGY